MKSRYRNTIFLLTSLLVLFALTGICQNTSVVYFRTNDYSLDNEARRIIDSLSKTKGIEKIYLQGHCDSIGSNEFNDVLSANRVKEVKKYFFSNGVADKIIQTKASGKRIPLNKNADENERALNRRVEIKLVSKTQASADEVEVIISGIVLNEKKQALISEISLANKNGNEIQTITSGKDGKYTFKAILNKKEDYTLTYYNDSSFVSSKNINISNANLPYKNLSTILPTLTAGKKYILKNLNFEGDTSQLIAASRASLEALYKLMKKNKSLVIRIEGHVNYPYHFPDPAQPAKAIHYIPPGMNFAQFNQWLSEERAKMVYNYLLEKGIDGNRISAIGFGATKMLFPKALEESEMAQNRRVEINVISVK